MKNSEVIFMFSGQGSHYYQMGRKLFEQPGAFRQKMIAMDSLAADLLGISVLDCLYDDNRSASDLFENILLTHPAIFMVECALAQSLMEEGIVPDYVFGASLGEYAAAVIAGCISLETGLSIVIKQAKLMDAYCQRGGMIAILSSPSLYHEPSISRYCELAALNFAAHFVVTAPEENLAIVEKYLQQREVVYQRLAVSRAFHSRWIEEAREPFLHFLQTQSFHPARIPVVCCAEADIKTDIARQHFWTVVRNPIRFSDTIQLLESQNVYSYIDVGPAGSLATFLKYTLPSATRSRVFSTLSNFGNDIRTIESVKRAYSSAREASF